MKSAWDRSWPALVIFLSILIIWEVSARNVSSPNFPSFTAVMKALVVNKEAIAGAVMETLRRALIGLLIAVVTMIPLGILIGRLHWLGDLLEPVIDMLRPLPPPAIIPLVMLFAGIGDTAKIVVIVYASSFPIVIHAIDGIRGTHPLMNSVSRSFRLTRFEAFWTVDLPATLPLVMTGIRLSSAYAFLVAVTAEMLLSTNGIGVFLLRSQETFHIADVLAGICVIAVIGWFINMGLLQIDRRLLHWHYATTGNGGK